MTDTERFEPIGRREPTPASRRPVSAQSEAVVRQPLRNGWRRLYGELDDLGVSVEWHDFELSQPLAWSHRLQADSLELCLNLSGHGSMRCAEGAADFKPLTAGFYLAGAQPLEAWRQAGPPHRFATVSFSRRFLRQQLAPCDGALHPLVERFVQGNRREPGLGPVHRLGTEQEQLAAQLPHPPGAQGARRLWYQSKVLQLMADFFFERQQGDELFCDRQKRVARERVDKVVALLRGNLAQPPDLEELGRRVGCSPFHLSRTFSTQMQVTIPQYLRRLRMERAAELLRSGKFNVTEAALEVGYSSLSHFSQAFCQTMGCCPGLYPLKTATQAACGNVLTSTQGQSPGSAAL